MLRQAHRLLPFHGLWGLVHEGMALARVCQDLVRATGLFQLFTERLGVLGNRKEAHKRLEHGSKIVFSTLAANQQRGGAFVKTLV